MYMTDKKFSEYSKIDDLQELRKICTQARWIMLDVENKFRQLYNGTSTSNNKTRKKIDDAEISIALVEQDINALLTKLGVKNAFS